MQLKGREGMSPRVFAASGSKRDMTEDEIFAGLLPLNLERAGK
jgi:hypothetical protein